MAARAASARARATEPDDTSLVVLAPAKVMRLAAMVDAIVDELHDEPVDVATRARLRQLYRAALVEVGSTLSDPLLDELSHLQPSSDVVTDDDLRVAVAQLAGWLRGLRAGLATGDVAFILRGDADQPDPA